MDDTHTKLDAAHAQEFTDHLNSLDPDIKFTTEGEEDGALAFLDTNTVKKDDGSLKVTIYRKPTHTNQYLNFESNHPLEHKLSVVRTLHHRATHVVTEEEDRKKELEHVDSALEKCGYPKWVIEKGASTATTKNKKQDRSEKENTRKCQVALPYVRGLSEKMRKVFEKRKCGVLFKPQNILRRLLCAPKDPSKKEEATGVVYRVRCGGEGEDAPCSSTYVGESGRCLKVRADEHRRPSTTTSEVSRHLHLNGRPRHHITINDNMDCLLYTSPSPRDLSTSRMPSSA